MEVKLSHVAATIVLTVLLVMTIVLMFNEPRDMPQGCGEPLNGGPCPVGGK